MAAVGGFSGERRIDPTWKGDPDLREAERRGDHCNWRYDDAKAIEATKDVPKKEFINGVRVRNELLVEGYAHGHLVAKAYRASVESDWFIGQFINNRSWVVVGQLHTTLSERLQRKLILSMLKELV